MGSGHVANWPTLWKIAMDAGGAEFGGNITAVGITIAANGIAVIGRLL